MSASIPDSSLAIVFAIARRRTCVAILVSDGISETAGESGGKDSVMEPMFDCTISVWMGFVSTIFSTEREDSHNQS